MLEHERLGASGLTEPDPEVPLRKLPAAERNAIRISRILDAAGSLVAQRGYEKMTTSQVALRAGVSPGLLYQFFADKREIMQALAARNLDRYLARMEGAIRSGWLGDWPATPDAAHLAGRLAEQLAAEQGDRPGLPTERSLVIAIKIADALVKFAFSVHPDGDDEIIQHAKRLIRIHLELAGDDGEAGTE